MEEADYARTEEDDYNRIVDLTRETDDLRRNVSLLKDELSKAESALRAANNELRDSSDALKKEEDKAASLQSQIERLMSKIEHERAATKDAEGRVQTLYADLDQARFAHRSVLNDRDEALADKRDIELQLEDLKEQWQETEERIEMLQAELEDAQKVADHAADVEHDIARMRDQIQDQERTIMIKDERISHLEMQVQKERQINYHTADAIARSKAASPVDDDRHIGAMAFDSLEAELSAIDDNEFYEVAWNEFSHIEETPLTYEPIAPRVVPRSSLHTQEAGSIEPMAVRAPRLTMDVTEAGSLVPREPEVVECSISVGEGISTEPVAVVVPTHELVVREGSSTEPVAAIVPTHALVIQESSSTEPVAAVVPTHALAIHQGTSTEPVVAAVPTHALVVQDGTSTEPVAATVPTHALAMQESTSTEPVAPTIPTHALVVYEMANTEPIEPARAPLSSIHAYETASFAPKAPMPTQNTFNQHAILDIAPRVPNVAALTVSVKEAGSTIPTVRHISTSSSLTQTDVPRLTSEFIHNAAVSTIPHVPVKAATAESLIQTDTPVLTSLLVNYATTSTAPVEPFEMIDAPVAKPEVSATFAVDISPVAPKADQRKSATITKGTQTVPESPKSSSSRSSEVGSITTTLEVEPIEQVVVEVEPKRPTSSTGVQASIELPVEETEEPAQATPPALPTSTNTKSSRTTTEWMLRILTTVLALFCLHLYLQLDAWRTANGVGYSNVASRYGAYGNGRHLFGVIPVGMSDSWLSRQISRHMLSALSRLETWAGAEYQPLY